MKNTSRASKLLLIPPRLAGDWWPMAWKHLCKDPSFSGGYYNLENTMESLMEGDLQLWLVVDDEAGEVLAAMLTEIQVGDAMQVVNAVSMGGEDLASYIGMVAEGIGVWARARGCDELRVEGRLGWESKLKEFGFSKQSVVMRRRLQEVH